MQQTLIKHLLGAEEQGGHSESLRLDWLTGKEGKRGNGFFNDPHP